MHLGKSLLEFLDRRVEEFGGAQYKTFGIFGVINYPLGYYMLYLMGATESVMARGFATLLSFPLIFTEYWPKKLKKYLNLYWFLTLLYCLPVFGSYTLLKNQLSNEWILNFSVGLFILFLIVDYVLFIILYLLGIVLGYLIFIMTGQELLLQQGFPINFIYIYTAFIILGCIFSRNKEMLEHNRIQTLKSLAGAVAHEMRTPLFTLSSIGYYLKDIIPSLLKDHKKLPQAQQDKTFTEKQIGEISKTSADIDKVTRQAFSFIDVMLMNLREDFRDSAIEDCSIKKCVEEALREYPFGGDDRSIVTFQCDSDFEFKGNPLLIKHIFFNLLKNSIYYVKAANKGDITIKTSIVDERHFLSFKDTGAGIEPRILSRIFDKFYSRTKYGAGIGLAFCKAVMKGLGGDITCTSQYGEYTEFILIFPPLENA
jgi:signal transduction histidine kinase